MAGNVRSEDENELTYQQGELVTALLTYPTMKEAAEHIGISERTVSRWLKLPHVMDAYKEAKDNAFGNALSELQSGMHQAIATLKRVMTNAEAPDSVQVRAAQIWLEMGIKAHEVTNIKQELAELQALMKESGIE